MTRCCKDCINLKSSVYNQTGQSYVEQQSLQRLMYTHLRRVLFAKSVVDSRNPSFTRNMQRRCRPASCKLRFLDKFPSNETIDKLAYDTEHQSSDIIRVQCRNKSSSKERSCSRERDRLTNDANCPCLRVTAVAAATGHSTLTKPSIKNERKSYYFDSGLQERTKRFNYEQKRLCDSKCRSSVCHSARSRQQNFRQDKGERRLVSSPGNESERSCPQASHGEISQEQQQESLRKLAQREEEEAQYAKFVYDITQEIVQNGLYTDRELKEVFQKHLDKSSGRLSKRRMVYEIYQLKISLNMLDDSEDEDEMEADLVYAEKFSSLRVPKPPTPPKVLNENKIIEKLESFRQAGESRSAISSPSGRKSVLLVDANPELVVTERDVLSTLADNHIDPNQIERIYRNLHQKSKEAAFGGSGQTESKVVYSHRPKLVDRCSSAISLSNNYRRDKQPGILRKEGTDFANKSMSPEMTYHRLSYLTNKQSQALQKCENWRMYQDDCQTQGSKDSHAELVEKEKTKSPIKVLATREKALKKDTSIRKEKVVKQTNAQQKGEKLKAQKTRGKVTKNEGKSCSSETSELFSELQETVMGKRNDFAEKAEVNSKVYEIPPSEDNEEIEEEIESVIDELPEKTPRKASKTTEKSNENEKELSSLPEKLEKEDDDEVESIATENSDESIKYSDDFSNVSETSSKPLSKSSTPLLKVRTRKYSSVKSYLDRFASVDDQKLWRISEGSSSSSSSCSSMFHQPVDQRSIPLTLPKAIKKRTSSEMDSFEVTNTRWNGKLSELSSDFYVNSVSEYCDPKCRASAKSCSDNCKFVKTNCRNLSKPSECLNKLGKSESSESTGSS